MVLLLLLCFFYSGCVIVTCKSIRESCRLVLYDRFDVSSQMVTKQLFVLLINIENVLLNVSMYDYIAGMQ